MMDFSINKETEKNKIEMRMIEELSPGCFKLWRLITLWRENSGRDGEPHEFYVTEKLGITRSGFFKQLSQLRIKKVL